MNWNEYNTLFDQILEKKFTGAPYDNEAYFNYTGLNKSRTKRWLKKNPITLETLEVLQQINTPQEWILITEPWCGDAAHSTPIVKLMADANDHINLRLQLRDSSDLIDSYLTNGGRSIPKLVVRDAEGKDLFSWGPRPKDAQQLVTQLRAAETPFDELNNQLQQWYNKNQAQDVQKEISLLISNAIAVENNH